MRSSARPKADGRRPRTVHDAYNHQDWHQDLNQHTYDAIEEDPNIIS